MAFLDELKEANAKAVAERDRRKALKAWTKAQETGAALPGAFVPETNGHAAAAPAELEAARAEEAVRPPGRFSLAVSPTGIAFTVFLLLLLAWPYLLPGFNKSNFNTVQNILVFSIVVTGLNIIAGFTGQLSLGQKIFVLIGGYTVGVLTTHFVGKWYGDPWLAMILAVILGTGVGALLGLPALRVKGAYLAIVTLAFVPIFFDLFKSEAFKGIFNATQGISDIASPVGNLGRPPKHVIHFPFTSTAMTDVDFYVFTVFVFAAVIFLGRNIIKSRWGRGMMAVRESEIAAKSSGVRVYRVKVGAFMISAAYAALAGTLFTYVTPFISPGASFAFHIQDSFIYVVMMIVGGTGTMAGPIVGATIVTVLRVILGQFAWLLQWQTTVLAVLAIMGVVFAPSGTVGQVKSQYERSRRQIRRRARTKEPPPLPDSLVRPRPRDESAGGDTIMETKGMSKIFGGLRANDKVSIAVKRGTVHSLIGPNGSGKTTFVNVVTGVYTPEEGEVAFAGERIDGKPAFVTVEMGMGRTFQNLQLWRRMTVLENVMVGLHVRQKAGWIANMFRTPRARREEAQIKARAMGLLQFVGLARYANQLAGQLSYGPQRYLEIARALALDPVLLILDEPAAGLNPAEVHDLMGVIRRIKETGITIFVIEHHMDLVMGVSDHISVLDYGAKIADGTPVEIQSNQRVIEAYLGAEMAEATT